MTARLLRVLRELVLWLGALAGLLAVAAAGCVLILGASFLVFRSGSMSPAIDTGALAMATPTAARDVRAGDIVTVRTDEGGLVTHRVVSSTLRGDEATLVLKGDANATPDPDVHVVTSVEKVRFAVPLAGYVLANALTPAGLVATAACCLVLFQLTSGRTGPPSGPGGRRRLRGRSRTVVATSATAAAVVAATGVTSTQARFLDAATMQAGAFSSVTVQPATNVRCVDSGLADYIQWTAPTTGPPPTGYRLFRTTTAGVTSTVDVAATPTTYRPTDPLTTYSIKVAALRGNFVSTQSTTSASITVVVLGVITSC